MDITWRNIAWDFKSLFPGNAIHSAIPSCPILHTIKFATLTAILSLKQDLEQVLISYHQFSRSASRNERFRTLYCDAISMDRLLREALGKSYFENGMGDVAASLRKDLERLLRKEKLCNSVHLMDSLLKNSLGESYYGSRISSVAVSMESRVSSLLRKEDFQKLHDNIILMDLLLKDASRIKHGLCFMKTNVENEMKLFFRKDIQKLYDSVCSLYEHLTDFPRIPGSDDESPESDDHGSESDDESPESDGYGSESDGHGSESDGHGSESDGHGSELNDEIPESDDHGSELNDEIPKSDDLHGSESDDEIPKSDDHGSEPNDEIPESDDEVAKSMMQFQNRIKVAVGKVANYLQKNQLKMVVLAQVEDFDSNASAVVQAGRPIVNGAPMDMMVLQTMEDEISCIYKDLIGYRALDRAIGNKSQHLRYSTATPASWDPTKEIGAVPQLHGVKWISLEDLSKFTNDFSESNCISQGYYTKVYKGAIAPSQVVAIIQRYEKACVSRYIFKKEIKILSRIHHQNIVSLVGFCWKDDEQMLAFGYTSNCTLWDCLSGQSGFLLDWNKRLRIALDAARGLLYLHELADLPIIDDVTSTKILLDNNLNVKVFVCGSGGLSRTKEGYKNPDPQGTKRSNIYSFGVVLLELLTGRTQMRHGKCVMQLVREAMEATKGCPNFDRIIDPTLESGSKLHGLVKFVDLAMSCRQGSLMMDGVVRGIETIMESTNLDKKMHLRER